MSLAPDRLSLLLQERESGLRVLGHLVAFWQRVDGSFSRLPGEIVEHDYLAPFEFLPARMKVIGLSRFFAGDLECHIELSCLGCGEGVAEALNHSSGSQSGIGAIFRHRF